MKCIKYELNGNTLFNYSCVIGIVHPLFYCHTNSNNLNVHIRDVNCTNTFKCTLYASIFRLTFSHLCKWFSYSKLSECNV